MIRNLIWQPLTKLLVVVAEAYEELIELDTDTLDNVAGGRPGGGGSMKYSYYKTT